MDSAPDIATSPIIYEVSSKSESLFTVRTAHSSSEAEITLNIDCFGPHRYDLNISDLELGDKILVHQDENNQIHTCRLMFESIQYCKYLQDLILVNSEFNPYIFSLYSLGTLARKLPSYGHLDILHTYGTVRIIKYNDTILRLKSMQIQPIEPNPYIYIPSIIPQLNSIKVDKNTSLSINSTNQGQPIHSIANMNTIPTNSELAEKLNKKRAVHTVIATNEEKQEFTAKPKGKRAVGIIIKMSELNTSQIPWKFEDISQNTQLSPIFDSESKTVSYEVVLYPVKSISKIGNFYEFTIRGKGKIYIMEEELGEFKDIITSEPEDVKVKFSLKTIQAFVYKDCIYKQQAYTPVQHKRIQNLKSHLIIQTSELPNHMYIDPDKLNILSSVFSHAKLLEGSRHTLTFFYRAVIIGYLTHLTRESTPSYILTNFIHKLNSKHVVGAKLKREERYKSLIEHLEILQSNRSLNQINNLLNSSKILKLLIRELKQIIKADPQSKEFQGEKNKHRKIIALSKILSKELNILIILHSPNIVKPFNIWQDKFEVIINLVFNSWNWSKVCLLYYEYHHAEDNNITIDTERFKCLDCKKLPHQVYFTSPELTRCQRCIFREEKRQLKVKKKIGDGANKGKVELVEVIQHQEDRQPEEEKEVRTNGNRRCDGCNDEYPMSEICNFSGCDHLLCYRCLIASDEQNKCEACKRRISDKAQMRAKSHIDSRNIIANPMPARKHNSSHKVDDILIQDTLKAEQSSDIQDLNQNRKLNTNNKKGVPDSQHQNPTNSKRRKRGRKSAKSKDNITQ